MENVPTLDDVLRKKNELFWSQDKVFDALDNRTRIVTYEQLRKYSSINQLLAGKNNVVLFIPVEEEREGHWVCIIRNSFGVEFFDSYGHSPSEIATRSPYIKEAGLDPYILDNLLKTENNVTINRHVFQKTSGDA